MVSTSVTLARPPAPAKLTVPFKVFPALSNIMLAPAADAVNIEFPAINAPVWEMFPVVAVAAKVPVAVVVPKIKPAASVTATFAPVRLTAPAN